MICWAIFARMTCFLASLADFVCIIFCHFAWPAKNLADIENCWLLIEVPQPIKLLKLSLNQLHPKGMLFMTSTINLAKLELNQRLLTIFSVRKNHGEIVFWILPFWAMVWPILMGQSWRWYIPQNDSVADSEVQFL